MIWHYLFWNLTFYEIHVRFLRDGIIQIPHTKEWTMSRFLMKVLSFFEAQCFVMKHLANNDHRSNKVWLIRNYSLLTTFPDILRGELLYNLYIAHQTWTIAQVISKCTWILIYIIASKCTKHIEIYKFWLYLLGNFYNYTFLKFVFKQRINNSLALFINLSKK